MSDRQIDIPRIVQSIGMEFYVKYYELFQKKKVSILEIKNIVRREEIYTNNSINTRISKMNKIFELGVNIDALQLILNSRRINDVVKSKIKKILKEAWKEKLYEEKRTARKDPNSERPTLILWNGN